jgi:hypothetical protein
MTTLGYRLGPGAQIRVTETTGILDSLYDRKIADVHLTSMGSMVGGTALTTVIDYTVPAGQTLAIESFSLHLTRSAAPSSVNYVQLYAMIGTLHLIEALLVSGTVGASDRDSIQGQFVYVPAATRLLVQQANGDTGGSCYSRAMMRGFTFQ